MNKEEAQQVFDGVMLGDAGLSRSTPSKLDRLCRMRKGAESYFYTRYSRGDLHLDMLKYLKGALRVLNFQFADTSPCVRPGVSHGKPYTFCSLWSRTCPAATEQRKIWYPQGVKEVKEDLALTPLTLSCWFMDDGSTSWATDNSILLTLSVASFNLDSVAILEFQLNKIGIKHVRRELDKRVETGSGINLVTNTIDDVIHFTDLVEPYMIPSFMYKIKRPWYTGVFTKRDNLLVDSRGRLRRYDNCLRS